MKSQSQMSAGKTGEKVQAPVRGELIGTRGEKNIFRSERVEYVVQEFSSRKTNGEKSSGASDQAGAIRNEISSYLFEYVEGFHIPTHYVSKLSETEMLVRQTEGLPVEVIVYNVSDKSLNDRYGLPEGRALDFPIIEHYYIGEKDTRILSNEYHLFALSAVSPEEFKQINRIASKVNAVLRGLCDRRRLLLSRLKLFFGRSHGQILVTDELSQLTCCICEKESITTHRGASSDENGAAVARLRDRLLLKV